MANLILQKGAKVRGNLHSKVKVHQDLCLRVGLGFGIFMASEPHPQQ
jgi:hypothetical protein